MEQNIIMEEEGIEYKMEEVEMKEKKKERGEEYMEINKSGEVKEMEVEKGVVINKNEEIMKYIGENQNVEDLKKD